MITKLKDRLNFTKVLLVSSFLFSILSSISKAENRFFYQLGAAYVEGNSHSTFIEGGRPFAGIIEGHRLDFGIGLSSKINNIKVDYILSYSPDAFGNQVDTTSSCPNPRLECRLNIKDSLDLGAKFYLPSTTSKITPTIYFGVSNADIQLKTFQKGSTILMMSHQRNWGATAGLGLNYDLNNNTAISLDYSWTAYEKNNEQITTFPENSVSRPEINTLSLKLKKYF